MSIPNPDTRSFDDFIAVVAAMPDSDRPTALVMNWVKFLPGPDQLVLHVVAGSHIDFAPDITLEHLASIVDKEWDSVHVVGAAG